MQIFQFQEIEEIIKTITEIKIIEVLVEEEVDEVVEEDLVEIEDKVINKRGFGGDRGQIGGVSGRGGRG